MNHDIITAGANSLASALDAAAYGIEKNTRFIEAAQSGVVMRVLTDLANLPGAKDLSSWVYVDRGFRDNDPPAIVRLHLREPNSPLLREIVQHLGVSLVAKEPASTGESLVASFARDGVRVVISGYLPESCQVVEEVVEDPVPDARVDEAGHIVRRLKRKRVVCAGEGA